MSATPYLTTPIYYVNDKPHIGHAYTTVLTDVVARFHTLFGAKPLFLTGTDEHGQKVSAAAKARGVPVTQHCDEMSQNFREAWEKLEISPDIFMRTTYDFHTHLVSENLARLFESGDIYAAEYSGWYSVADEMFLTDKEVVDGKSPTGREVVQISERNYFFRMSKYQARLIEHLRANPNWILPSSRYNEVLGFLQQPLADLCISRPRSRVDWGIPLPFDEEYVTYVWFDALLNYYSALQHLCAERSLDFDAYWREVTHVMGKDILTTHTVYWPTMLMALGWSLPKQIVAHGWWLGEGGVKMSKSLGNVVDPLQVVEQIGADAFRYFLMRGMVVGQDATLSHGEMLAMVNADLGKNYGNLVNRLLKFNEKEFGGKVPTERAPSHERSTALEEEARALVRAVKEDLATFEVHRVFAHVRDFMSSVNKYLSDRAPWKEIKSDRAAAGESVTTALEAIRVASYLLRPALPVKASAVLRALAQDPMATLSESTLWGVFRGGEQLGSLDILFPRFESAK